MKQQAGFRLWLAITSLLLLALPSLAYASGCGTLPSGISGLITSCIPVNIVNTQSAATSSGFQQMLSSFPTNALQGNFVVYNSISGALLPAWVESNSIVWVNLGSNTIAGSSSANGIYDIGYGSSSTNFFISGNDIGEAPQLSSTYAEYDNGASVFNFYDNFAGTSLSSKWTSSTDDSGTVTVSNGVTFYSGTARLNAFIGTTASYTWGTGYTVDAYNYYYSTSTSDNYMKNLGVLWNGTFNQNENYPTSSYNLEVQYNSAQTTIAENGVSSGTTSSLPTANAWIVSTFSELPSSLVFYTNYTPFLTATVSAYSPSSGQNYLGVAGGTVTQSKYGVQWYRVRITPPNGVMPSVTYGSAQSPSSLSLTYSPSASVSYGTSVSATATCTPSTDNCAVQSPLGTNLCTGTGSCPYPIPNYLAAGSYTYYANDLTLGTNQPETLTVSASSNDPVSCTYNGNPATASATYVVESANVVLACSILSISNQVKGNLYYNGIVVATGYAPTNTQKWDDQLNTVSVNTIANPNYTANSLGFNLNEPYYTIVSNTVPTGAGYETSTEGFKYNINITKAATSANMLFQVNGANTLWNNQTVAATNQIFTFAYPLPLLPTNNVAYVFNALPYIAIAGYPNNAPQVNSLTQTELWDYIPTGAWKYSSIVEGAPQMLISNLTDVNNLGNAIVDGVNAFVGNKGVNLTALGTYKYYYNIPSFTANAFGFATPTSTASTTITTNAITYNLTFGTSHVYRTFAAAPPNPEFTDGLENLVPCNALYTNRAFNWTFWNASNPTQQITQNVLFNGYYQIIYGKYSSPVINGTAAGLSAEATANSYLTCETPSNAIFPVVGGFTYSVTNSLQSNYYLLLQPSQPENNIHLYVASAITAISQYDIGVQYVPTLVFLPALVEVKQYVPNSNSSVVVNEFKTTAGGGYTTSLQSGQVYSFSAFALNGTLLATTPFEQASCPTGQICTYNIQVGGSLNPLISQVLGNLVFNCVPTPNAPANTETVACNFNSVNGTSYPMHLIIWNNQSQIGNSTIACIHNATSASGSLSCTVPNINLQSYMWAFQVKTLYGWYTLQQNVFGYQAYAFGNLGLFLAIIIIIVVSFLLMLVNPALGIMGAAIALDVDGILGLVAMNGIAMGAILAVGAFVSYIVYEKVKR